MTAAGAYDAYDVRPVLSRLFHPRPAATGGGGSGEPWSVPVGEATELRCVWFDAGDAAPTVLLFHGNGEIAADYDDLGPRFNDRGINLLVAEYRGYGRSGGAPTVAAMMADAHTVLAALRQRLQARGGAAEVVVMGRSLGSAPAVELAATVGPPGVAGLIVESGFGRAKPLLRTLGVPEAVLCRVDGTALDNVPKIGAYPGPTLVIHGAQDQLIPVGDGQALYQASGASHKDMLVVPRADHNSLFVHGLDAYLDAVGRLVAAAVPAI